MGRAGVVRMKKTFRVLMLVTIIARFGYSDASAQIAENAIGLVQHSLTREPISGARVMFTTRFGEKSETVTDSQGRFVLPPQIEAGTVSASAAGFLTVTRQWSPTRPYEIVFRLFVPVTLSGVIRNDTGEVVPATVSMLSEEHAAVRQVRGRPMADSSFVTCRQVQAS